MRPADLEFLREIFGDKRVHFTLAKVTKAEVTPSRATMRVQCSTLPEELEIVATVCFPSCSQGAGFFLLPQEDDLGVVAYSDLEEPYWIGHLSSPDDLIPQRAVDGDLAIHALDGQNAYLAGDNIFLTSSKTADPASPLVLGDILMNAFTDIITDLKAFLDNLKTGVDAIKTGVDAIKSGPVAVDSIGGSAVTHPTLIAAMTTLETGLATLETNITSYKAQLDSRKSTYVDTDSSNIVSQIAFTERGG
jgi:hypothetical protein